MSHGGFSRKRHALERRRTMAERWALLLETMFYDDAEVAETFGIEASTIRKWRSGKHAPSGYAVDIAYQIDPAMTGAILGR